MFQNQVGVTFATNKEEQMALHGMKESSSRMVV
jgi:hypothetical protein